MPETLVKLAQVGTDQARCALFGKLCERVTKNIEDRTTQELAIFAEVALKLYADAALSDRIDLARSLSDCPDTPRPLGKDLQRMM